MISKSPEIINYISVVSTLTDGATSEVETIISGIKCSVQESSKSYKLLINGNEIVSKYVILISEILEINKVPDFDINDKIQFNGSYFKVLGQRKRQYHIEIYV